MMNTAKITILCSASLLLMSACTSSSQRQLPPGEYKSSERSVNEQGTELKTETKTNIDYDEHGYRRVRQETEASQDPKGLFNKSTSTSTQKNY